jgi:hypothetical protein
MYRIYRTTSCAVCPFRDEATNKCTIEEPQDIGYNMSVAEYVFRNELPAWCGLERSDIPDPNSKNIIIVTMHRYANLSAHAYVAYVGHSVDDARDMARCCERDRGGKYAARIVEHVPGKPEMRKILEYESLYGPLYDEVEDA